MYLFPFAVLHILYTFNGYCFLAIRCPCCQIKLRALFHQLLMIHRNQERALWWCPIHFWQGKIRRGGRSAVSKKVICVIDLVQRYSLNRNNPISNARLPFPLWGIAGTGPSLEPGHTPLPAFSESQSCYCFNSRKKNYRISLFESYGMREPSVEDTF